MKSKLSLAGVLIGLAMLATPISAAAKDRNHQFGNNGHAACNFGRVVVGRRDFRNGRKATWLPAPPGLYPVRDSDNDDRGWRRDWDEDHDWYEDRDWENEDGDRDDDDDYGSYYPAPVYGAPVYAAPVYGRGVGRNCWKARHIVSTYWRDRNTGHPAAAYDLFRQNQWAFRSGCGVGPAPYNNVYSGYGYGLPYGGSSNLTPLLQQFVR